MILYDYVRETSHHMQNLIIHDDICEEMVFSEF